MAGVKKMAFQRARKIPVNGVVDVNDFITVGAMAVVESLERFDVSRGWAFSTYWGRRAHGAMSDLLRSVDFVPRLSRKRGATGPHFGSFDKTVFETDTGRDVSVGSMLAAPDRSSRRDQLDAFNEHLKGLDRTERMVLTLYYFEDLTMKQIGEAVGLSESRVSQLHSALLLRLNGQMTRPES